MSSLIPASEDIIVVHMTIRTHELLKGLLEKYLNHQTAMRNRKRVSTTKTYNKTHPTYVIQPMYLLPREAFSSKEESPPPSPPSPILSLGRQ